MTKAVLFDFGGTLLSHTSTMDGRHRRAALLAAELGRDDHEAVFEALHLGIESAFERAKALPFYLHLDVAISGFREAVSSLGVTWSEAEGRAMARRTSQMVLEGIEPRPGMRSTLEALRERGLHLGGVSNADDGELEAMVATLGGGGEIFHHVLSSETARSCKPHAAIFRLALAQASCDAVDAVFVGDTSDTDIVGAAALGMRTVLIEDRTAVRARPAVAGAADNLRAAGVAGVDRHASVVTARRPSLSEHPETEVEQS